MTAARMARKKRRQSTRVKQERTKKYGHEEFDTGAAVELVVLYCSTVLYATISTTYLTGR